MLSIRFHTQPVVNKDKMQVNKSRCHLLPLRANLPSEMSKMSLLNAASIGGG